MAPPPPPAPPPLPKGFGNTNAQGKLNNCEPPPDRNALLSQIRKGTRLKKAETNDRSTPLVGGNGAKPSSNGSVRQNNDTKSNSCYPIIPPGGLFAQGIPKLRPTVPKSGDNPALSSMVIQSLKAGKTTSLDHLRIGGSRSQPPSPVSKPRMASSEPEVCRENSSGSNPNFPDDVNIKGPAPVPPPASQKPVFRCNTGMGSEQTSNKLTTVKRSASQTNLGQRPRLTRPPPNVKPPPPPKANAPPQTAPPPPPSKPPNILRRQSFGVGEGQSLRLAANKVSIGSSTVSRATGKAIGPPPPPPPPPRNNSAPQDLNQMVSSSSPNNHWSKMNIAPPPPPNRVVASSGNRTAVLRPPPPRAPAPPPPPQHQFSSHPAPPSQMKAIPSNMAAPPPPTRISSIKQTSDFEDRFKFHSAQSFPKPERYPNTTKTYPSKANQSRQRQSTRRQPPPPPPQSGDSARSQPVLHIQLESGIFSNNFAHS